MSHTVEVPPCHRVPPSHPVSRHAVLCSLPIHPTHSQLAARAPAKGNPKSQSTDQARSGQVLRRRVNSPLTTPKGSAVEKEEHHNACMPPGTNPPGRSKNERQEEKKKKTQDCGINHFNTAPLSHPKPKRQTALKKKRNAIPSHPPMPLISHPSHTISEQTPKFKPAARPPSPILQATPSAGSGPSRSRDPPCSSARARTPPSACGSGPAPIPPAQSSPSARARPPAR